MNKDQATLFSTTEILSLDQSMFSQVLFFLYYCARGLFVSTLSCISTTRCLFIFEQLLYQYRPSCTANRMNERSSHDWDHWFFLTRISSSKLESVDCIASTKRKTFLSRSVNSRLLIFNWLTFDSHLLKLFDDHIVDSELWLKKTKYSIAFCYNKQIAWLSRRRLKSNCFYELITTFKDITLYDTRTLKC